MINEMREVLAAAFDKSNRPPIDRPLPVFEEPVQEEDDMAKSKLQEVGGLGLDAHKCFDLVPGEDGNDPFSVPREVTKERMHAMIHELAQRDMLVAYNCFRDNPESTRNFFDLSWAENCRIYDKVCNALRMTEEDGLAEFKSMSDAGELANYGVGVGEDPRKSYYHLSKCFKKYESRMQCLSRMNPVSPK
jgi:hypothetical protein